METNKFTRRALLALVASVSGWLLLTPRRPNSEASRESRNAPPASNAHPAKVGSGRGAGGSAETTVMLTNGHVFRPQVTWVNGRAKITNATKPNLPPGTRIGYTFDGGPRMYLDNLPDISFPPFTQINIFSVISPNPLNRSVTYTDRADCIVTLGSAPI